MTPIEIVELEAIRSERNALLRIVAATVAALVVVTALLVAAAGL